MTKKTAWKKGTNNGKGFYCTFANGTKCWTYGFSATEVKYLERNNGKIVSYIPA